MMTNKQTIRSECLRQREIINPEAAKAASMALAAHLSAFLPQRCEVVAGYRATRGEIDPLEALMQLSERGHELCLPVIERRDLPLAFRRWRVGHPLKLGQYGIEVPPASEPTLLPQAVIVPIVAFDKAGHRLGYGGGFYDRTIAQWRKRAKAEEMPLIIGAAYAAQRVEFLPAEGHDERLDAIVTDEGVTLF
jgi:5-formyltetrahydrofolate cyclo-ligase